ncbi:MAG: MBL fold metallo-hydrolase [Terriglobales bacterium]|jgi:7,8-dihydropterin-6-yl-methyl-4-(beta-D-ribofuranosyl)aminobenzene 5'-phosphate synthase
MLPIVRLLHGCIAVVLLFLLASLAGGQNPSVSSRSAVAHPQVNTLKVTILSTMLADQGIGEWGFSALVEADGHRVLVDTGYHPETVLQNAKDLGVDLSTVTDVVLTHNHDDHVGGFMTLRRELMKKNPSALSRAYVAKGIFYSRPSAKGEGNTMIAIKQEYEATGGKFIEHDHAEEIFPGAWLTGPVPRVYPERNWSVSGKVETPTGLVEDNIPEDQSLVINTAHGLILISGCGHAGIINTLTMARGEFPNVPVYAVLGGFHLFAATDAQVDWTADKLKDFGTSYLLGAHCTGIESVYRIRQRLGLPRGSAVVAAVGATFVLGEGIHPGEIAQ